jgi:uncharacterized membrane protein SirB2
MHLAGLTLLAGTNVVEYVAFRSIFKTWQTDQKAAIHQINMLSKLPVLLIIGGILLLLSGAGFVIITHDAFGSQLWFKIKMLFVLVLIVNGFLMGRRNEIRLKESLTIGDAFNAQEAAEAIRGMIRFYLIQLCLFFMVVLMAVFKFN